MKKKNQTKNTLSASSLQFNSRGEFRHFLDITSLPQDQLIRVLDLAESFLSDNKQAARKVPLLRGKTVINLFFESSTRTRSTFELAAKRLSADVLNLNINSAAVQKGESFLDTLKNMQAMGADMFVVRHRDSGAAQFIAQYVKPGIAVINAGDGSHAHPTQALLDMFTIRKYKGGFSGLKVAIIGDVYHSRVARSQISALTTLGVDTIHLVGPQTLVPNILAQFNTQADIKIFRDSAEGIEGCDVIIMLRLQKERMQSGFLPSENEYYQCYGLNSERLSLAAKDAIVMHPGPMNREVEISSAVADGEQSVILDQVHYGVVIRMAVMSLVTSGQQEGQTQ